MPPTVAVSTVTPGAYVGVWSGTPAHFTDAMSKRTDIRTAILESPAPNLYRTLNALGGLSGRLGGRINWEVEPTVLRALTNRVRRQWQREEADVVIAMGWMPMGLRDDDPPVLFWGDATIAQRVDRATHWSRLSRRTRGRIGVVERRVVSELTGVILPSDWAINGFANEYGLGTSYFHRVPFGANIHDPGPHVRRRDPSGALRVLTVGVDWHRKGVDIAVRAVDLLRAQGIDARLDVVGAAPPSDEWRQSHVTYHGFLSKKSAADAARLTNLYELADVFLLPSRSDPSPMVLGEAGAYALPIVAADVDGIPERVDRGGRLVAEGASALEYMQAILDVIRPDTYVKFSVGSRADYENFSTWEAATAKIVDIVHSLPAIRETKAEVAATANK